MIKEFFIKKMIDRQMQGVPEAQKNKIVEAVMKNPQFFEMVAKEMQQEMATGKDQMAAMMAVLARHKDEAEGIAQKLKSSETSGNEGV